MDKFVVKMLAVSLTKKASSHLLRDMTVQLTIEQESIPKVNKKTGLTGFLRFVPLVHLPFIFRYFDLFVASRLFMKGILYCYKEKN